MKNLYILKIVNPCSGLLGSSEEGARQDYTRTPLVTAAPRPNYASHGAKQTKCTNGQWFAFFILLLAPETVFFTLFLEVFGITVSDFSTSE